MNTRKLRSTTLDAWDDILNDGTLGEMQMKALELVTDYPGLTVRELLRHGVQDGVYANADRNLIAPRITSLAEECIIVRPEKRPCMVTGKTVMTHRLAPESWQQQRRFISHSWPGKKYVRHRLEVESRTQPGVYHTCIMWTDGSVSCTCNELYHRPSDRRCFHARGLVMAATGRDIPAYEEEKGVPA